MSGKTVMIATAATSRKKNGSAASATVFESFPDIVWRTKEQFDEGSGTIELLEEALEPLLGDESVAAYRRTTPGSFRSDEEALYHRMLCEGYARPEMILRNVARWTEGRPS